MSLAAGFSPERELLVASQHVLLTGYITMAGLALMVWDHMITLRAEISLPSAVKVLFLLNRYVPPVFITIDTINTIGAAPWLGDTRSRHLNANELVSSCRVWILADVVVELLTVFAATFLIGMRVHILWDNRRDIFLWVSVAWVAHVLANIGLVILSSLKNAESYSVNWTFNICFGRVEDTWTVWIPVMIYHCFIMALLMAKSLSTPRIASTRVHDVMIRDGFAYFVVVFLALLFNLLSWALAPATLAALPRWVVWAICTTATSRLLLSLKGIQNAEDWNNANKLARKDIEMETRGRDRVKFVYTEHEDDLCPSHSDHGCLRTTTLGKYDD